MSSSIEQSTTRHFQIVIEVDEDYSVHAASTCTDESSTRRDKGGGFQRRRLLTVSNALTGEDVHHQILQQSGLPMADTILEYYDGRKGSFSPLIGATVSNLPNPLRVIAHGQPIPAPIKALPWRAFDIDLEHDGLPIAGIPVRVHGVPNSGEGTGHTTWDGAIILSKYLEHQEIQLGRRIVRDKRVLETGAGKWDGRKNERRV